MAQRWFQISGVSELFRATDIAHAAKHGVKLMKREHKSFSTLYEVFEDGKVTLGELQYNLNKGVYEYYRA